MAIKPASYQLQWLIDMMSFFNGQNVVIPAKYREQVLVVKKALQNDETGIVNTVLDFSIGAAVDVDYAIETTNPNLSTLLNNWLTTINSSLRGKIPTGIEALAKEYYRERWKGSSQLLLRTKWENVDGYNLPTKLWFVDGEDIITESDSVSVTLGSEKYYLRVADDKRLLLNNKENELIFVQKPYESWGTIDPTPFLIQRGIWKNMQFYAILSEKGITVANKALEYLMMVKKGTEALAREGRSEFIYDSEDLRKVKEQLGVMMGNRSAGGTPTHVTNFDTEIEHLIPDYKKILDQSLYSPIEKRLLSGLGMIDIVDGASSSRRESILNPKPLIEETASGVGDFCALIKDVLITIAERNRNTHRKQFSNGKVIKVRTSPLKIFTTNDDKVLFRSMYDRGAISKQTFVEVTGDVDYAMEVERRKAEEKRDEMTTMFPPVVQNTENMRSPEEPGDNPDATPKKKVSDDDPNDKKTGPEAKNFKSAGKEFEQAPYNKNTELPDSVKVLPARAQTIWRKAFNSALEDNDETTAIKIAWSAIKNVYQKKDEKWVKKTKAELASSFEEASVDDLERLQKLAVLGKQNKLLDKFLEDNNEIT